ncbi:MAG: hypothetical protein HC914_12090 [Chloroflexaceae bacterium]|nr:hypothetical protein [Chloroflexaceae bacterium]
MWRGRSGALPRLAAAVVFAAVCLAVPLIGWLGAAPVPEHAIPIYPVLLLFGVLGGLHLAYRTLGKRYSAD